MVTLQIQLSVHLDYSNQKVHEDGWTKQSHCSKLKGQFGWPNLIFKKLETSTQCELECDKDSECDFCITETKANGLCFLANFKTNSKTDLSELSPFNLMYKKSSGLNSRAMDSFQLDNR